MAVGDVKNGLSSVATGEFLDIQPSEGEEWVIHNVYHEDGVELYLYDGTNSLLFDAELGKGIYAKFAFHVTNSIWVRVKNTAGSAKLIGYDGVQTK